MSFLQLLLGAVIFEFTLSACKNSSNSLDTAEKVISPDSPGTKTNIEKKCGENFDARSIPDLQVNFSDSFVSRTIQFELDIPADKVTSSIQATPLEKFLPETAKVPGVRGTKLLIGSEFGPEGSRRLVCLTDYSYASEEVIENVSEREFKYKVWNYTSNVARPIEYAIGEFKAIPLSQAKSQVTWTYSFKLKDNEFPGYLAAPGRFLFKKSFVDSDYADFMTSAANAMKSNLVIPK
jgi:hypothetical protein